MVLALPSSCIKSKDKMKNPGFTKVYACERQVPRTSAHYIDFAKSVK